MTYNYDVHLMGRKKRHHYVPQFYLEGFVDPRNQPYIWVYEKGNSEIRKAKAENIAFEKHYYSFTKPSGEKDTETFENAFADLESRAAPILEKIKKEEALSDQEKGLFSYFIAYSMTRVPNYRKNVERIAGKLMKRDMLTIASDPEGMRAKAEKLSKERSERMKELIDVFLKRVSNGEYEDRKYKEFSLDMMKLAKDFTPIIFEMNWAFLRATDEYKFVTSDNPLYYFDPTHDPRSFDGVGLMDDNLELYFPVSNDLMLLGTWKRVKGYNQINNKLVRQINRNTVIFAQRFIFSSQRSKGLAILVEKHKDIYPRFIAR